jgi:hypothetical protein
MPILIFVSSLFVMCTCFEKESNVDVKFCIQEVCYKGYNYNCDFNLEVEEQ